MNRSTNWIVAAATAEMVLVAIGAVLWRGLIVEHLALAELTGQRKLVGATVILLLMPLWVALAWFIARRQIASRRMTPSAEHIRLFEISFVVGILMLVVMQGFLARSLVTGDTAGRELLQRGSLAFAGVFTLVQGNFMAKVAPPTGPAAPPPHAWMRMRLAVGWASALIGLALLVCSVSLPITQLRPLTLIAFAALVGVTAWHRSRMKAISRLEGAA